MNRKARERGFRVDFRQRVRVAASHLGQLEPRDGCGIELLDSRRASVTSTEAERAFPASEQEAKADMPASGCGHRK